MSIIKRGSVRLPDAVFFWIIPCKPSWQKDLIIDGHGLHISIEMIQVVIDNNILYCLPPHTTHILQPLDVAVYRPLKAHFSKITDFIVIATTGQERKVTINNTNFSVIFEKSLKQL